MKWKLEIIDWNVPNAQIMGYDVQLFCTLSEVWDHIGFRLNKHRFGYAGLRNNIEYRLTRW